MTEVYSIAYIHNFFGINSDTKFVKLEDYQKLLEQIEKMKCCGNCKYFTGEKCTYAYRTVNYNDSCETWGLAE